MELAGRFVQKKIAPAGLMGLAIQSHTRKQVEHFLASREGYIGRVLTLSAAFPLCAQRRTQRCCLCVPPGTVENSPPFMVINDLPRHRRDRKQPEGLGEHSESRAVAD